MTPDFLSPEIQDQFQERRGFLVDQSALLLLVNIKILNFICWNYSRYNSVSSTGVERKELVSKFAKVFWIFTDTLTFVLDSARVELVSE